MTRLRALLPILGLVLALGAFVGVWRSAVVPGLRSPPSAAMDLLPLWLGAALVEQGHDPGDAAAAEAQFARESLPVRPGGFYSYYPPTASLVAMPLRPLGWRTAVPLWRWAGALSVAFGAAFAARAGFGRTVGVGPTAVALGAAAFALATRPARIILPTGQPGPLVVGLTGLALWLLATERGRAAGAVAAAGAAVKLVPGVLLGVLVARRQWAAALAFVAVVAALVAAVVAFGVPLDPAGWTRGVFGFVSHEPLPSWGNQPGLLAWWRVRVPVVAVGSVVALGALVWRPGAALAVTVGAVLVGAVGVIVAGTHHYHEALVLVPALVHALAWPAQAPRSRVAWGGAGALALACLSQPEAFQRSGRPDSLIWIGLGGLAWAVLLVRVAVEAQAGRSAAGASTPLR